MYQWLQLISWNDILLTIIDVEHCEHLILWKIVERCVKTLKPLLMHTQKNADEAERGNEHLKIMMASVPADHIKHGARKSFVSKLIFLFLPKY